MKTKTTNIGLRLFPIAAVLLGAMILSACGPTVHYIRPPHWKDIFKRDSTIASYRDVLQDVTVFVDPGHGGDDRDGVGPAGDVVEADVNLRVALSLRDYLKKAGVNVMLSRENDVTVPLAARAEQANANKAEIFVSIHHNAAGNPFTNYTATFYHARPGIPGYAPSSRDLARYIQRDLSYAMGNPGPLASFDGTMSDYLVFPDKGFAVLRNTRMTAVLVECGFFTSEYEEQRLRLTEFNEIQAWGIFLGIGKYFQAGIPRIRYESPLVFSDPTPKIELTVSDRSEILDESIRVYINGEEQGFTYNRKTGNITVSTSRALSQGYHHLTAQVRNSNGNSSGPFELHFAIGKPPVILRATADPPVLPPDRGVYSVVSILALDSTGSSVADGLPIRFRTSNGVDTILTVENGIARINVYPDREQRITFEAMNGPIRTDGVLTTSPDAQYTRGLVMSTDGKAVPNAEILLPGSSRVSTSERGEYIIAGRDTDGMRVVFTAPGYFGRNEVLTDLPVQDPVLLSPIAHGVLIGKTYILDLAGEEAGGDGVDYLALRNLRQLLLASGARVISTQGEGAPTLKEALALYRDAPVFQFTTDARSREITLRANGLSSSRDFGVRMQRIFPQFTGIGLHRFVLRIPWREELKNHQQISVTLPMPSGRTYAQQVTPLFSWNIAWAVYASILAGENFGTSGTKLVEVTVHDEQGNPAPYVLVELNHSLIAMTDNEGICRFPGVSVDEDEVRVLDSGPYIIKGVRTEMMR
ncbi:MAG: N-acetylmuramoyl-L-alanine amidase [Bacteroidetes bacterium]|nr:N-acetylmuramoyl-L-alanine amidase [Bacteroidota bacterium]